MSEDNSPYLAKFVEVQLVGKGDANFFLSRGYSLLAIIEEVREEKLSSGTGFISRRTRFVVGRPDDVASVQPERWVS